MESHRRASAAISAGYFRSQIVPVEVRKGRETVQVKRDEGCVGDVVVHHSSLAADITLDVAGSRLTLVWTGVAWISW